MLAIISTVALTLTFTGAFTTPDAAKSNAVAAEGWQLWQQHKLADALEKFEEAVKLNPDNAEALNGLGWTQFGSGTYDEAEKAWQAAIKLVPNHPAALNGLGQLALMQRQYDKAEKYLLKAAENNASAAWYGLARLYLLQGKFEPAEEWAQKLVDSGQGDSQGAKMLAAAKARNLNPELRSQLEPPPAPHSSASGAQVAKSTAAAAQAWKLWQQRKLGEALTKFEEAVKLNPNNTNALNGLGWVQFNSGTNDEAEKAWQKCLALAPNHAAALNGLGQLALMKRQYDKAETYLLKAADNNASTAYFGLARVYLLQGKYEQAEKWAQKLVTAEPSSQEGPKMLAAAKAGQLDPELRNQLEPPSNQ